MTDVEIIYLKKNKYTNQNSFEPDVLNNSKQQSKDIKKPKNKIEKTKPKKYVFNLKRTSFLITFFIILIMLVSSSFNAGFIPVKNFLEIKEPIGKIKEINIQETAEKYSLPLNSIASFEGIKYKVYSSSQTKDIIEEDYKLELKNEGFNLKCTGTKNIKGFNLNYYGFIKGITVILILTSSDNIFINGYETLVLYSAGSVFDYAEIIKDNRNFLDL